MTTPPKRPGEEVSGGSAAKIPRNMWRIVLEDESDLPTDESEESVHTIQERETDFAKDTSDTSYMSSDERCINMEYEVDSLSAKENPLGSGSLSSDVEAICSKRLLAVHNKSGSTFGGSSADSSSFDPEIPRADYWTCVQCKTKYNKPGFRYCQKCYQVRKDFFPPRPRRKRKRNRKNAQKQPILEKSISNASTVSVIDLAKDEPIAGPSHIAMDSGVSSMESCSSKCDTETAEGYNGNCITCLKNPKNGIFLHGKIGHICCCYNCAVKVWIETQRCPICKSKVRNVVKAIVL